MQIRLRHNPSFAVSRLLLEAGESVQVESGAMMAHSPGVQISSKATGGAYDLGMQFTTRRAVEGRSIQSMKSGEGLVFDFVGPGRVLLQSRNPQAFAEWAARLMPSTNEQGGLGGLFN